MKAFYILTLVIGIHLAVVTQFITFAIPPDAFVAGTLSGRPEQWSLTVDEDLGHHLSRYDLKTEVTTALDKRSRFVSEIYKQSLLEGLALIVLSVVGLVRERTIHKLKKIEPEVRQVSAEAAPSAPSDEPST